MGLVIDESDNAGMGAAAFPDLLTVDDFLRRPERDDGFFEELIDGEVIELPSVTKRHSDIAKHLYDSLLPLDREGFVVQGEVACRLSDRSLPNTDVCVIRRERWDAVADDDFLRESPALAVEVHSPSNRRLRRKAELYLEHGAEQVWLVYPKTGTILVLTQDGDREVRPSESIEFHGLRIPLSKIF